MTPSVQKPLLKTWICLALAAVTFAAFAGVARCSFIALDDWLYVVDNPSVNHGFSWSSIQWALTAVYAAYWIPVTWLSHILDCQLYGINPTGHHLTSLIFHVANTVLLFLLLERLTSRPWPSGFVALLFGIHPMHVESVAWIAERKDVLSAFFFLLTLFAYTRYVELAPAKNNSPSSILHPRLRWMHYALSLVLFALGLMSKPMIVTLPFVLLLLDFWPLRRFEMPRTGTLGTSDSGELNRARSRDAATQELGPLQRFNKQMLRRIIVEKLPFFILSAVFSYTTVLSARIIGAVKSATEFSLADRLGHIPVSFAWYVGKFFWPADLSVLYLWHKGSTSDLEIVLASLLLLGFSAFALCRARANPYLIVGWLWFLGMLVPVIGAVQAGDQAYADRFTYLPYIGLFIIIAWGIPELLAKMPSRNAILCAGVVIIGLACFWRTVEEVRYWKTGITLLDRAVALDPRNEMAWGALGFEYEVKGSFDKALECEHRALSVNNRFYQAWNSIGNVLAVEKNYAGAENAYQTALPLIRHKWDRISTFKRLGDVFDSDQKYAQAIAAYRSSLALAPNQADTQAKLGLCLVHAQQPDDAAVAFQNAIALQPNNADAYLGLGLISQGAGLDSDAVVQYRNAIKADPNTALALNNLAWILAADSDPALRNGPEAVSLAERACRITHDERSVFIGTLANAYAEAGRFDDALATAKKAHDVALAHNESHVAERNAQLLKLYKTHKAFHMGSKE
jgi:tetratricopeptide (TPR) repeat protein